MRIFLTGASGYIGGSVAKALVEAGQTVRGLVRSAEKAEAVRSFGVTPVTGTLDHTDLLAREAADADAVIHAASADHVDSVHAMLAALERTEKTFVHTSGSSLVGTAAGGQLVEDVFDEDTPYTPAPLRVAREALTREVQHWGRGVRTIVIAPSLIYGAGRGAGAHSMQVPWLLTTAHRHGVPKHLGPGENRWSNVHLDDLVDLYLAALADAPSGAFFWAENGENSMRELCQAISRAMGQDGQTEAMTLEEAAEEWGEGPATSTMGSNSRVRARRARAELGWAPHRPDALHEIEHGCYRDWPH